MHFSVRAVHNVPAWTDVGTIFVRHRLGWLASTPCEMIAIARQLSGSWRGCGKGVEPVGGGSLHCCGAVMVRNVPLPQATLPMRITASAVCTYAQAKKSARGKERKQSVKAVRSSAQALPACSAIQMQWATARNMRGAGDRKAQAGAGGRAEPAQQSECGVLRRPACGSIYQHQCTHQKTCLASGLRGHCDVGRTARKANHARQRARDQQAPRQALLWDPG